MENYNTFTVQVKNKEAVLNMIRMIDSKEESQENEFLDLMQTIAQEMKEKWDFVQGIEVAKTNIKNFSNETIHKMKDLNII